MELYLLIYEFIDLFFIFLRFFDSESDRSFESQPNENKSKYGIKKKIISDFKKSTK